MVLLKKTNFSSNRRSFHMEDPIQILIDLGSTFTKVVALDIEREEMISAVKSPSTVSEDVTIGLKKALDQIGRGIGERAKEGALACSSAAGGLRVVSIGLVPELSSEAAKRAALGAGAKIVGHFSYELNQSEMEQIERISPDLILLAGGTDGGNKKAILHNANLLSCSKLNAPIVVAGNKSAYDEIKEMFCTSSKVFRLVHNVMPEIGRLEVEACREAMREVFMENIIKAKGIDRAKQYIREILMPTPVAVLKAALLLSQGIEEEQGWGELIVIDVGGATTDVNSIAWGHPTRGGVLMRGLPEPFAKRTVEGDLGVRYNIDVLREIAKEKGVVLDESVLSAFQSEPSRVPQNQKEWSTDTDLARMAVQTALERHVGKLEVIYGPMGEMTTQIGKDLSHVTRVIGTGGPIAFSPDPRRILAGVLADPEEDFLLKPKKAEFYVDERYILFATGLLAQTYPKKALRIMKRYLKPV